MKKIKQLQLMVDAVHLIRTLQSEKSMISQHVKASLWQPVRLCLQLLSIATNAT